jgi:methylthioribose-1-phosphate isomerase
MPFIQPIPTICRDGDAVVVLDQTRLPHAVSTVRIETLEQAAQAIHHMQVRGAPLIGVTAAFGVALALREAGDDERLEAACARLAATRPTAVNLHWALARMRTRLEGLAPALRREAAWDEAESIRRHDHDTCAAIGRHGAALLRQIAERRDGPVRVLTHCNAGWLATCGAGTALAPIFEARAQDIPVHVWVSETRPRNQGLLTEWELREAGVPHTLVVDNAAGILLARGEVDVVITGADRIAANGDTANKVGTYLKALAARDNGVPMWIAAPCSTVDFTLPDGSAMPIEERDLDEVRCITGIGNDGRVSHVRLAPATAGACNLAFDVTPARLIDAIVTEAGTFAPGALASGRPEPAHA